MFTFLHRSSVPLFQKCSLAFLLPCFCFLPLSAYHPKASQQWQQKEREEEDMLLYKRSERQCSANNFCKEEDFFHYYGCSFGICDFHLQPWLYVLIAFIMLCFLLSVLISLINCVCCRN